MIRLLMFSVIIVFCLNSLSLADLPTELPNWIDHSREFIDTSFQKRETVIPLAPPHGFKLKAEYEPVKAVVVGWAGYTSILREVGKVVTTEGNAEFWALQGPTSIEGIDRKRYKRLGCRINTSWMRDYGPFGILEGQDEIGIVDSVYRHYLYRRKDDRAPSCIGEKTNVDVYPMDLVLDGGNVMVDSSGNLFMTSRTYEWNQDKSKDEVDQLLKNYFNVKTIHVLDYAKYGQRPADGTGHIDMFIKLLSDSTVLIAKANSEPFRETCEKAVRYFSSIKAPDGSSYKILRVKGERRSGTWYTYTNSLIVNGVVLVPGFGHDQNYKATVAQIYKAGMKNIKVRFINSDSSITSGGAIHCLTQLIPKI